MSGNFWKGLALGIVGLFLWIFFSFIAALSSDYTSNVLVGLSFTLMIFGPILFWIVFPLKDKWYAKKEKRKLFYLTFIPILILFLIFLGVTFSPPEKEAIKTPVSQTNETTPQQSTPTEGILKLGETAVTSEMEVTVISFEKKKSYYLHDWEMNKKAESGKIFVIVNVELKNVSDDIQYASPDDFSMSDSENFKYDPEGGFLGADIGNALKHTELLPGEKVRGKLVFEIPENAIGLKIKYNFAGIFEKPKIVSWILE